VSNYGKLYYGRVPDFNWACGRWLAQSNQHANKLGRPVRGEEGSLRTESWDSNPTKLSYGTTSIVPLAPPLVVRVNGKIIRGRCVLVVGDTWAVYMNPPAQQLKLFSR